METKIYLWSTARNQRLKICEINIYFSNCQKSSPQLLAAMCIQGSALPSLGSWTPPSLTRFSGTLSPGQEGGGRAAEQGGNKPWDLTGSNICWADNICR